MKPLKIYIEPNSSHFFSTIEIKFVFKTLCRTIGVPWQFLDSLSNNEPIDIYYGNMSYQNSILQIKRSEKAAHWSELNIVKKEGLTYFDFEKNQHEKIQNVSNQTIINPDIIYASFFLLTGKFEENISKDKWDRHEIKDTLLYKEDLLHTPIVDQYAKLIKKIFNESHSFLPKWPNGAKVALALSHDTDYPEMIKWIEALRYTFQKKKIYPKKIWEILSGKESFWRFEEWLNLEESYGFKSAFYMCSFKGNLIRYFLIAPDTFYNINKAKYKDIAKLITGKGWEIGLHSSFNAYKSEEQFKKEKEVLATVLNTEVVGNRHHYWHLNQDNPSETALIHQKIGLEYDTSVVFEKHSGFRYGICSPYQLFNKENQEELSIYQLPPTLMDDHLFGYAKNAKFASYQEHIDSLIDAIYENEGIFVTDFHTRVLNETFFPDWGNAYKYLLSEFARRGECFNATPKDLTRIWAERASEIEKHSIG